MYLFNINVIRHFLKQKLKQNGKFSWLVGIPFLIYFTFPFIKITIHVCITQADFVTFFQDNYCIHVIFSRKSVI
jgi:hypothetical protein